MSDPGAGPTLAQHPCQLSCGWEPTGQVLDGLALFRCGGCRSEWVRSQLWTPVDSDGQVSPRVAAEAARRGPATSGRGAGAAGSADS